MALIKFVKGNKPTQAEQYNRALARRIASEGFVLLENDGVLPLKPGKVALCGNGSRMTVKGGEGAGAVHERYSVSIADGLKNAGYEILTEDWLDAFDRYYQDSYEAYKTEMRARSNKAGNFYAALAVIPPFSCPDNFPVEKKDIRSCDTAIYVITRQAGEGHDRANTQGDYQLSQTELHSLEIIREAYEKLIVIINVGGQIDLRWTNTMAVNALVFFAQGGEEGGNALADVLSGKANFSGKLTMTWAESYEDIPSHAVYSEMSADLHAQDYIEDIYVGYRYFDSFYAAPKYPFGYGRSYTSFTVEAAEGKGAVEIRNNTVYVSCTVTNSGDAAGKEVLQMYATVPFGEDGAEFQRLTAFEKTPLLQPQEVCRTFLSVKLTDLAKYSEKDAAWVLEQGDYILRIGNSSRNTVPVAAITISETKIVEQCENACVKKKPFELLKPKERTKEDLSNIPHLTADLAALGCVKHSYHAPAILCDPLIKKMTDEQLCELVVGGGVLQTDVQVAAPGSSGTTTPKLYDSFGIPNVEMTDGPAGLRLNGEMLELSKDTYAMVKKAQNIRNYERYFLAFPQEHVKQLMQGFVEVTQENEALIRTQFCNAWPCELLQAQTFDTELLTEMGDCIGTEMELFGITVFEAPAMNIQRNTLGGRTYEYISEDPYVSGMVAAAITEGVQRHRGQAACLKHFACNNCELNRDRSDSNLSERALREIYLKGFQIAIERSRPLTIMAAYNQINGVYSSNNYDLLTRILRQEWDYQGLVMSDWDTMKADPQAPEKPLTGDVQKAQASGCDLIMPGRDDQIAALLDGLKTGSVTREDLERSATRVLSLVRRNSFLPSC